jgi:mannose/fructose/N-acetylgalactosamine-specific phosphotransferase system component IIB
MDTETVRKYMDDIVTNYNNAMIRIKELEGELETYKQEDEKRKDLLKMFNSVTTVSEPVKEVVIEENVKEVIVAPTMKKSQRGRKTSGLNEEERKEQYKEYQKQYRLKKKQEKEENKNKNSTNSS